MTTREAAAKLSISYEWLKKRAQRREVPCVRLGRQVRFTTENLAEIVKAGTQEPALVHGGRGSARSKL
jgi:excisionase family DNA binding protein